MSRAPKRTPRERLLAYYHEGVGCEEPRCGACKHFAKLLRAHERDLAQRATEFYVTEISIGGRGSMLAIMQAERLRAAILQRSATPKRGRR